MKIPPRLKAMGEELGGPDDGVELMAMPNEAVLVFVGTLAVVLWVTPDLTTARPGDPC
jgi:hypothetical protein